MCKHDNKVEEKQTVKPPVECYPFTQRYTRCIECGVVFATTKQRRKNRQNFNQAMRKYRFNNNTHGIYY